MELSEKLQELRKEKGLTQEELAFVQDGTRNVKIEADREKYSQQIKSLFDEAGLEYICLSGDYLNRYEEVKRVIKEKYGI